jgi:hypothetical protein
MTPLAYAELGLAVFACHHIVVNGTARCSCGNPNCTDLGKHPYGRHAPNGFKNASKDPRIIGRWSCGPYNIAIATGMISGVIVVDIDPRNRGDKSRAQLEAEHGPLPPTWRAFTGGAGEHIYFAHPGGYIPCSEGKVAPGIDIKGDGGYVIAPPSRHISGRRYAWDVDHHPEHIELAAMPPWLIETIATPNSGDMPKKDWKAFVATPIVDGTRHNALKSLAGLLFYRLARETHLAAELLIAFNQTRCNPPLQETELLGIIDWAAVRETQRRRAR